MSQDTKQRLEDIAARMKKATGEELDRLVAEVDAAIGFDIKDTDPETDADWELSQKE